MPRDLDHPLQFNNDEVLEEIKRKFVEDGEPSGIAEHGGTYNPFPDNEWLDSVWYKSRTKTYQSSGMH